MSVILILYRCFFRENFEVLSMAFVLLYQTYLVSFGTPTDFAGWKNKVTSLTVNGTAYTEAGWFGMSENQFKWETAFRPACVRRNSQIVTGQFGNFVV